jgi:hypothetical protein
MGDEFDLKVERQEGRSPRNKTNPAKVSCTSAVEGFLGCVRRQSLKYVAQERGTEVEDSLYYSKIVSLTC